MKKNDNAHINVVELDATMKGINLALKWGLQAVEIRMDSATVASWIKSEVSGDRRIKMKEAAEMLIKCQLGDLIREFRLKISYRSSIKDGSCSGSGKAMSGISIH